MGKNIVYAVALSMLTWACKGQEVNIDKTVVKELDLERYLGKWYEVARYDHSFERGLVGVSATYSERDDGLIKVVNAGFKETLDGEESIAIGKAKIPNAEEPSKLKVSFFWIFYGDYLVLDVDDDYQWAIIGSRSDNYLWILSRTPQIEQRLYLKLLDKVKKRGYDVSKLIVVEQPRYKECDLSNNICEGLGKTA